MRILGNSHIFYLSAIYARGEEKEKKKDGVKIFFGTNQAPRQKMSECRQKERLVLCEIILNWVP